MKRYTVAAYYFPNWHRKTPREGRNFGEWPRLKVAPRRFPGHAQPKVPLWGYEDESDPKAMAKKYAVPYYPNVTMGWDATPRIPAGQPHANGAYPNTPILKNNTPVNFKRALFQARAFLDKQPAAHRILGLYAWNEWTEGGYLEPDTVHRYAYLKAVREVFG